MEDSHLGALLVLIGGITYLAFASLTLGSAVAAYLVHQIPISESQSILLTPISLWTFTFTFGGSLVQLVTALLIIGSARAFYSGEPTGAKGRAWRTSLAALVGAVAAYVLAGFTLQTGYSQFVFNLYYGGTGSAPFLGLVATIAGAWFSYWGSGKTNV